MERVLQQAGALPATEDAPTLLDYWTIGGCVLPYNLTDGSAVQDPYRLIQLSEADTDPEIDTKFYFENLSPLQSGLAHSFRLTSVFPFSDNRFATVAVFPYRFRFSIGSSGRYCFLPLPEIAGYVGYSTSGPDEALVGFSVDFGVRSGGSALGHGLTTIFLPISDNESFPVDLTLADFLNNDPNFTPISVELDSSHGEAEIDVGIAVYFANGSDYYSPNSDGKFELDCESFGGQLGCEIVKWGRTN